MEFFSYMFSSTTEEDAEENGGEIIEEEEGRVRGGHAYPASKASTPENGHSNGRSNGHSNGHDNSPDTCEAVPLEGKATVLYSTSKADLKGEDRFDLRPLMTATAKDVSGMRREKLFSYFAVLDGHNGQACVDYAVRDPLCALISPCLTPMRELLFPHLSRYRVTCGVAEPE